MSVIEEIELRGIKAALELTARIAADVAAGKKWPEVLKDVEFWLAEQQAEALERARFG